MKTPLAIARRIMRGNKIERPLRDIAAKVLARSAIVQVLAGSTWALQQLDDATCAVLARDVVEHVCAIAQRNCDPVRIDWGGLSPEQQAWVNRFR